MFVHWDAWSLFLVCIDFSMFLSRAMNHYHSEGFQVKDLKKKRRKEESRIGIEAFTINCQHWYDSPNEEESEVLAWVEGASAESR